VGAYVYNIAMGQGLGWRVPEAPFVMETFCMGDHGIVSGCRAKAPGRVEPALLSPRNDAAEGWGLRRYRSRLYEFCAALDFHRGLPGDDVRPLVHQVMDALWCHPTRAEAVAWGHIPTTLIRRLDRNTTARPAIHGTGLRHPRRPRLACGITRLEHSRGPRPGRRT